jgi:AAA domain
MASPSLIDPAAERALLGVLMREPRRLADARIRRALFAWPPHPRVLDALRAAHDRNALGGDPSTASAVVEALPGIEAPRTFVVDAMMAADDVIPEAIIGHLVRLGKRRLTRRLASGLAAVADNPMPDVDREALATIGEQVAALAEPPVEEAAWRCLADVAVQRVAWLWQHRVPLGKVTLLEGDPGLGKSTLTLDIAARVSRGAPLEGDTNAWEPAGVVIVGAEDGLADTLRPRLEAAGADLARIVAFQLERLLTLPNDLASVRSAMRAVGALLVIFDPLMAFLASGVDSYRDQDVRRVLRDLAGLAAETGAAILIVRHLTKQTGSKALYRGGGSIGIAGAARSVLLVAAHPQEKDQRVLAPVKSNLCASPPALAFTLDPLGETVRVGWHGVTSLDADALVTPPLSTEDSSAIGEAIQFLETLLAPGPVAAKLAERQRREVGISDYAWKEARRRLGVEAFKEGFSQGWALKLPSRETH